MARCVIAVVGVAPCQCLSFGGHQTTSPGRISTFGPPSLCTHPHPDVTISVSALGYEKFHHRETHSVERRSHVGLGMAVVQRGERSEVSYAKTDSNLALA